MKYAGVILSVVLCLGVIAAIAVHAMLGPAARIDQVVAEPQKDTVCKTAVPDNELAQILTEDFCARTVDALQGYQALQKEHAQLLELLQAQSDELTGLLYAPTQLINGMRLDVPQKVGSSEVSVRYTIFVPVGVPEMADRFKKLNGKWVTLIGLAGVSNSGERCLIAESISEMVLSDDDS